jgi:hypothetical protein
LKHFGRHDYPYYYDEFDDRILRIPGAKCCDSVAHVHSQTLNLASFTVEIATKCLSPISKMIEMKSHVVTYKGVKQTQFRLGRSILGTIHSSTMVIVLIRFLQSPSVIQRHLFSDG